MSRLPRIIQKKLNFTLTPIIILRARDSEASLRMTNGVLSMSSNNNYDTASSSYYHAELVLASQHLIVQY
jgi:hypothetical protein